MRKPLSEKHEDKTLSSERPGETKHGMHIVEDKDVFIEVIEEKSEHDKVEDKKDNRCNVCDKRFKSVNFLKNHDIKYHQKRAAKIYTITIIVTKQKLNSKVTLKTK